MHFRSELAKYFHFIFKIQFHYVLEINALSSENIFILFACWGAIK